MPKNKYKKITILLCALFLLNNSAFALQENPEKPKALFQFERSIKSAAMNSKKVVKIKSRNLEARLPTTENSFQRSTSAKNMDLFSVQNLFIFSTFILISGIFFLAWFIRSEKKLSAENLNILKIKGSNFQHIVNRKL